MADPDVPVRIAQRADLVGVTVGPALGTNLATYLELLTRWNRKINLTALGVEPLTDEAIDRLVVEPLAAARWVRRGDRVCIDIGSGGGSPAIPFKLAIPAVRVVMVEAKARKSSFLREVIRHMALNDAQVENCRFEDLLSRTDVHGTADVVTLRAVRADGKLLNGIQALLRPYGRVFWFGAAGAPLPAVLPPLSLGSTETLVPALGARLLILEKS